VPGQTQNGEPDSRGLEGASSTTPGPEADRLQSAPQRALRADAGDVDVPAGAIEASGDLDELATWAATRPMDID